LVKELLPHPISDPWHTLHVEGVRCTNCIRIKTIAKYASVAVGCKNGGGGVRCVFGGK
jgi:hypothetical protein